MADEHPVPPDHDPEAEISDHVNDYLETLRARFNELTERIEEASRASIDRDRADLEDTAGPANDTAQAAVQHPPLETPRPEPIPDVVAVLPASEDDAPHGDTGPDMPSLAARIRSLAPEEQPPESSPDAYVDRPSTVDEPELIAAAATRIAPSPTEVSPPVPEPPSRPPAPMPRPVNRGGDRPRLWVVGTLVLLILLSGAFLAGRWWSSRGASTEPGSASQTTTPPATAPPERTTDDETIRVAVNAVIAGLAPDGVTGDVSDGVVVLTGSIPDATTREALSDAISAISGVRQLDNRTEIVAPEPATPEQLQLAADEARAATGFEHLDVTVTDGVATITGVVSVDTVSTGVFASIAPLHDALTAIDGIDRVVTRVQLRGDEAALRAELRDVINESPIIFESGSAELDEAATVTLDRAAEIINSYPGLRVLIAGHTDAAGGSAQNEALAAARGQAVLGYLISKGVPVTRLQVVSYGELFPGAGSEQSLNRRIEFEVAP